ncbi:hypothetical protein EM308_17205 [Flavobacterium gilvum]|uniref:Uncharacterized protein n=1 Tax=Flavobacterium gilvum TaxID=1492737 RepID=A0AAC9I576_9FLAO|nr:hypothetical protein EM308_17205 [Flavobacterium gilvum]
MKLFYNKDNRKEVKSHFLSFIKIFFFTYELEFDYCCNSFIYRKERKVFQCFSNTPQGSQSFANLAFFKKNKSLRSLRLNFFYKIKIIFTKKENILVY